MRYAVHLRGSVEGPDYTIVDVDRKLIILGGYIPRKAPVYGRCDVEIPVSAKTELKEVIWSILKTQNYGLVDSYTEDYLVKDFEFLKSMTGKPREIFNEIIKVYL